jgi:hypothetical protein
MAVEKLGRGPTVREAAQASGTYLIFDPLEILGSRDFQAG